MQTDRETPLPFAAISALGYAVFLYLALGWVRVRLVAPDMLVFALVYHDDDVPGENTEELRLVRELCRPGGYSRGCVTLPRASSFPFSVFPFGLGCISVTLFHESRAPDSARVRGHVVGVSAASDRLVPAGRPFFVW